MGDKDDCEVTNGRRAEWGDVTISSEGRPLQTRHPVLHSSAPAQASTSQTLAIQTLTSLASLANTQSPGGAQAGAHIVVIIESSWRMRWTSS